MQLSPELWLVGPYYVDFDQNGQLRIVGPHNHLYFGSVGLTKKDFTITDIAVKDDRVHLAVQLKTSKLELHDPAMGHIRKVRQYVEVDGYQGQASPTFAQVMRQHPAALSPTYIGLNSTHEGAELVYRRYYGDHWYGVTIKFGPGVTVSRVEKRRRALITSPGPINITLIADTDQPVAAGVDQVIVRPVPSDLLPELDKPYIKSLLERTAVEATHLIQYNKTSGFSYGTVFPRDWLESAELSGDDLTPEADLYMYHKSLEHTDEHGQGWHEDIVGEFASEKSGETQVLADDLDALIDQSNSLSKAIKNVISRVQQLYVNREMIDIEPRYLLGLRHLKFGDFSETDREHLRRVASYVLVQAETHELITFKRLPEVLRRTAIDKEFTHSGNWRDSEKAFKMIHPVIAPYDVNAVFYPQALTIMAKHSHELGVNKERVELAARKWANVGDWFRFTNPDGRTSFALALYDVRPDADGVAFRRLEVNHTDEAYELFYGQPAEADVVSFCHRLLDANYFYTASGPLVVGAHDGYDTTQYHGMVIWTKQTAWVAAGLAAQYRLHCTDWRPETVSLIKQALLSVDRTSIDAFTTLGAIPELHYDHQGKPSHYTHQPVTEGPSNTVQLWSAVGARRIIRTYNEALTWR